MGGSFVGHASKNVAEAMAASRGGVLFIDEAYELGQGAYGEEAMTKLISLISDPLHNEDKTIVVLAGYRDDMNMMLDRNAGMRSRFRRIWKFESWTSEDCSQFCVETAKGQGFSMGKGGGAEGRLKNGFDELRWRSGWANARDALAVYEDMVEARSERVFHAPEARPTLQYEDADVAISSMLSHRPKRAVSRSQTGLEGDTGEQYQTLEQSLREQQHKCNHHHNEATETLDEEHEEEHPDIDREELEAKEQKDYEAIEADIASLEAALRELHDSCSSTTETKAASDKREDLSASIASAKKKKEAIARQRALRECGVCPMNFTWKRVKGGYRCTAGSHFVSDADVEKLMGHK